VDDPDGEIRLRTTTQSARSPSTDRLEIQYRWANNELDQLPTLAAELVHRGVAVIVAPGAMIGAIAAKRVTGTIPIVFQGAGDPVALGLAASLGRPGGNVTGLTTMGVDVTAKRLGILQSLLPGAERFAALVHPKGASAESIVRDLQTVAATIGLAPSTRSTRPLRLLFRSGPTHFW